MEKLLMPIEILDNRKSARFISDAEIIKSLPQEGQTVLWKLKDSTYSGDSNYLEGHLINKDENGYYVHDILDNEPYTLDEFSHWYKEVTLTEIMGFVPAALTLLKK